MLALNINNPTVENFFKVECNGDNSKFVDNLLSYIQNYKMNHLAKENSEFIQLSNNSLDKIWDNSQDAEYDKFLK